VAVVELGANHFGEIETLARIARPNIGLVTGAGHAHLEFFGNQVGVARAKGELYRNLPHGSTAVVNVGDSLMMAEAEAYKGDKIYFGLESAEKKLDLSRSSLVVASLLESGLHSQIISLTGPGLEEKPLIIRMKLPGDHNALNAAAAAAVAYSLGVSWEAIKDGLSETEPVTGRLSVIEVHDHRHLIDDSYNANPTSVAAALKFLSTLNFIGGHGAILGDMLELGAQSQHQHYQIGIMAAQAKLSWLALVGNEIRHLKKGALDGGLEPFKISVFEKAEAAAHWVIQRAPKNSVTLIKGSRSVGLEKAVSVMECQPEYSSSNE
jgi:UDP-N-acetylmuramoyl-tripeptide--D-alanyl-D-alanine ligase